MPHDDDKLAMLKRMWNNASHRRANWESRWQSVSDIVRPGGEFISARPHQPPSRKHQYDATAAKAVMRLGSAFHGLLTNPASRWFALFASETELNDRPAVRRWLDEVERRLYRLFASERFGFNTQAHETYLDLASYGTAGMSHLDTARDIEFTTRPLSEFFLVPDETNRIRQVIRKTQMTPRRMAQVFGLESLSEKSQRAVREGQEAADRDQPVLHFVFPREDRDPTRLDNVNKPFASFYVEAEAWSKLRESGFDEMPYLTPRFTKVPGEPYGEGPGMYLLPDIGMINQLRRVDIVGAEKQISPPLMVAANSTEGQIRTAPNSIIYTKPGMISSSVAPLNLGNRVELGEQILANERRELERGFFLDLLELPDQDRMTATEVMQRVEQKLTMMSPMLSRLFNEWLAPMVTRSVRAMAGRNMLPDPPPELEGQEIEIEFVSMMALSQRRGELTNLQRHMELIAQLAQFDPSVLQVYNIGEMGVDSARLLNVPTRYINSREEVEELRRQFREQQAQAQQAQTAATAAEAAERGTKAIQTAAETQAV